MPLTPISDLMHNALAGGYAVGYFESWNFESLQGVIDAAEQSRSPVIIGFNGEFLSDTDRLVQERFDWYGALGKAAAESTSVPCGFIFNECPDDASVRRAVTSGFNLVMPIPFQGESDGEYTARVRTMVTFAHAHNVAVEAELGTLPYGGAAGGELTDPDHAARFVEATGIDLLAISAGNIHVLLRGQHELNCERIAALHEVISIPLVLHGGTGISGDSLREAIKLGVAKVNYGTAIKQRYLDAVRRALDTADPNPHHLLGMGGTADVMVAGRRAVCEAVLEKIALLGCEGKADGH